MTKRKKLAHTIMGKEKKRAGGDPRSSKCLYK